MKSVNFLLYFVLSILWVSASMRDIGEIQDFPFVARLEYNDSQICSAGILSRTLAVTAARCLHEKLWVKLSVCFGTDSNESSSDCLPVTADVRHPHYNHETGDFDIAVVAFAKIDFSESVRPLKLYPLPADHQSNVLVVGWAGGQPNNTNASSGSEDVFWTKTQLIDVKDCKNAYESVRPINPTRMFCTEANQTDTCLADDGALLITENEYIALGIVSNKGACPQPNRPSVFINFHSYEVWHFLKSMMQKFSERSTKGASRKILPINTSK
ncbi:hypothetical protein DMENIID0001_059740 [Sergentomyia squamirostris]